MNKVEGGYLRIARRRWPAILVCLLVGLGAAFGITRGLAKTYQANSQVFINVVGGNSVSEALDATQLASELVQSYAYVASSSSIASQIQSTLHLASPPSITATAVTGTLLVDLSATESSPGLAQSVLSVAMSYFSQTVKSYEAGNGTSVTVRTVQPASASPTPVSPKRSVNLVYGGLSGLLVGLLLAGVLDYLDKSFRDASDLDGLSVGPLLGEIPSLKGIRGSDLLVDKNNDPAGFEAYSALRASLRFLDPGKPLKTILFTSPSDSDGKTTTVANLVEVLARGGEVAVGVDADLRRPALATAFGVPADPGLTSVVIGSDTLGAAMQWRDRLGILPPGPLPPNPSEILGAKSMVSLIAALADRTDRVLIDAPATTSVSDPLILAPLVDGVVLVLKPGSTKRDDIAETCRRLEVVGARVVGYVLNMSKPGTSGASRARHARSSFNEHRGTPAIDLQLVTGDSGRTA